MEEREEYKIPPFEKANCGRAIVSTKSIVVLAPKENRTGLTIKNISSTAVYIALDTSATVLDYQLAQHAVYKTDLKKRYTGPISAITSSGSADLRYIEY